MDAVQSTALIRKALARFSGSLVHFRECPKFSPQMNNCSCTCGLSEAQSIAIIAIDDEGWAVYRK